MSKVSSAQLLTRFRKIPFNAITFESDVSKVKGLFTEASLQPENNKKQEVDPNTIYIPVTDIKKKRPSGTTKPRNQNNEQGDEPEQRQRNYRPGPFALFYKLNEGTLNKEELVWYYKNQKQIVGPVSSYNMDIMVYIKEIQDETKVAFKSVDKFVKFKKIKSILEDENVQ